MLKIKLVHRRCKAVKKLTVKCVTRLQVKIFHYSSVKMWLMLKEMLLILQKLSNTACLNIFTKLAIYVLNNIFDRNIHAKYSISRNKSIMKGEETEG